MSKNEAKSHSAKPLRDKNKYDHSSIELKWQAIWEKEAIYQPDLSSAKNSHSAKASNSANATLDKSRDKHFYNLMMFPYPSAEGLHIGGVRTFGGVDIYGRFQRMKGHTVFEPFGLDGFGIHAENYALKIGAHPMEHSKVTEKNYYRQMRDAGIGVDWSRTVETYKPEYYKWTQWLFTELFKAGLAYRKKSPVNYCPGCKTVLADEQVIDGMCERCGSVVEKKNLEQWFFKITKYADRLLTNIDKLNWTEKVKIAQRNWIGKREGINITFDVADSLEKITVFTTTPINFGATFLVIAPEHPILKKITTPEHKEAVEVYMQAAKEKAEVERLAEGKEKTGVFTGAYVINHLNGKKIPVWVADYVLINYGTGAVQGCPGHDQRDFEFAKKYNIPTPRVVIGPHGETGEITNAAEQVHSGEKAGKMINSDFLNGIEFSEAMVRTMDYFEEKGWGKRVSTYHLRDWLISRQRYWGPPIPMIYCEVCAKKGDSWFSNTHHSGVASTTIESHKEPITSFQAIGSEAQARRDDNWNSAGWYPVEQEHLPVTLPHIKDFKPLGTGKSPLANHPEFYEVKCPRCGSPARRETDVSDTFLDSAWYFFRYISTEFDDRPFDKERAKTWLPVTMYIGGAEHSVLHLLYARFVTMVLHDLGYISFEEPFSRFYAHGLVIKEGAKMSKSKGNVITPDVYIKKYGADTVRTYLQFMGPFNQDGDFRDSGIEGMHRFLIRVWKLFQESGIRNQESRITKERLSFMHQTIKGITEDMEELRFNTAIAKLMTWYNFLAKQEHICDEETEVYLKLLAPFAPHMTEELYQEVRGERGPHFAKASQGKEGKGKSESIHMSSWPEFDEELIVRETVTIAVQVNGKLRGTVVIGSEEVEDQEKIEKMARSDEKVTKFLIGKVKHVIFIPGKVLNFVIG